MKQRRQIFAYLVSCHLFCFLGRELKLGRGTTRKMVVPSAGHSSIMMEGGQGNKVRAGWGDGAVEIKRIMMVE